MFKIFQTTCIWFLFQCIEYAQAEYKCVCSFDGARPVFTKADNTSGVIGFLKTNGCRQFVYPVDETWNAIVFMHQLGYIMSNTSMIETCFSEPVDSFTTEHTTSMTIFTTPSTSKGIFSSPSTETSGTDPLTISDTSTTTSTILTQSPTTKTTSRDTNQFSYTTTTSTTGASTMSTTVFTSLSAASPEGNIELCPSNVKDDVNLFHGYLGQYGNLCLELVPVKTQWHNAQRHCSVAGHGDLVDIRDKWKQDYVLRFLANHTDVKSIWLGLTDSEKEGAISEGQFTWVTGGSVSYSNLGPDYMSHTDENHNLNDCVIMKQGGEWTDVPCGVALVLGTGFGESHCFICQYSMTSKPFDVVHELGSALVG
ncbi:aggrecan core protein-like isoform X2 [Dreissena polymorpha]|uniref:C-type lectin domain-containing protein n=1 Tax=Dreissena polymorpha TaxID=45954 RepID=A0A9D4LI25_DREPO|nr:aggrecan core protein-like isoform X2 [Dreissena polymorpha]KAH3858445.1 hypothetical protein DPMN_101068 [Dreissena polymorpha]